MKPCCFSGLKDPLRDAQVSHGSISQNPPKGHWISLRRPGLRTATG